MHALYIASVFLHVVAAIVWIGGMFFLILVVVPWLRRGNRAAAGAMLRDTGIRFRAVGWWCFGVMFATGALRLWLRRAASWLGRVNALFALGLVWLGVVLVRGWPW